MSLIVNFVLGLDTPAKVPLSRFKGGAKSTIGTMLLWPFLSPEGLLPGWIRR
jgi:hypothetical protein